MPRRATCTWPNLASSPMKARKAQSLMLRSTRCWRLRWMVASADSRRRFCRSTAILVQATSITTTGGGDLPLHTSVDNTSEAVNSTLESCGTLDIATCLPMVFAALAGLPDNGIRKQEFKLSYCQGLENFLILRRNR